VTSFLSSAGLDARAVHDASLVLEELLTNALQYGGASDRSTSIAFAVEPDRVSGEIGDSGVDFVASIGIRHLEVARGAGMLVLLDPNPTVTEVLFTSALQDLLPIVRSENEARALLARKIAT